MITSCKPNESIVQISIPNNARIYCEKNKIRSDAYNIIKYISVLDLYDMLTYEQKEKVDVKRYSDMNLFERYRGVDYNKMGKRLFRVKGMDDRVYDMKMLYEARVIKYSDRIYIVELLEHSNIVNYGKYYIVEDVVERDIDKETFLDMIPENERKNFCYENGLFRYMKEPTYELCCDAVKFYGHNLYYIKDKTEELCAYAFSSYGKSIGMIDDLKEELCKIALKSDWNAIRKIMKITKALILFTLETHGEKTDCCEYILRQMNNQDDDVCYVAVSKNWRALKYVKNQKMDLCRIALKQDIRARLLIKNKTEEIIRIINDVYKEK